MEEFEVYTDGACSGNPGPGGWGFVYIDTKKDASMFSNSGGESATTNNRMELLAVISALGLYIKCPHTLTVVTDSKYVMQGMTEWIINWKKNNWIGSNKKPVKNKDLWLRLDEACSHRPNLKWRWVKGHAGNKWNEEADRLSVEAIPKA